MLTKQNILICLLSLTVISPAMAKVYKWTDANGKLHYTSTPPPTNIKVKESKELKIHKTPKTSLTFKPKYQAPIIVTQEKKKKTKKKIKRSVRKKTTTVKASKKECEGVSLAKRESIMRGIEKNGKKLLAKGIETKESYKEKVEMFRQTVIDCKNAFL